ncbi:MAG: hypothetical protein H6714_06690 [Myxococcales bacterium]|nr:hypothetical protein [Myxococcales bacterium]
MMIRTLTHILVYSLCGIALAQSTAQVQSYAPAPRIRESIEDDADTDTRILAEALGGISGKWF